MRRFALAFVLPTFALLAAAVWPLVCGRETLYLRDAFNVHLPVKWTQAEALRAGRLPLVDPQRGGGQAQLGNPNTVPLYPDNLLYLAAPTLWAFNAHFWLHLLLAPLGLYALARALGIGREGAWTGGVAFAGSGYFLSQLNFYNLVAGTALAPAFAAALVRLAAGGGGLAFAATGLTWTLLLLAGDPVLAALALPLAVSAAAFAPGAPRGRQVRRPAGLAAAALALGTLAAAPQLGEFLRLLPLSFRGYWGYSPAAAAAASWHPAGLVEWLLPLAFGPPDLTYWGHAVSGGQPPLFYSLHPGLLAVALAVAVAPRPGVARWAWGLAAGGGFFALGRHNPLVAGLLALPGADLFRFPVKFWLLVAVGAATLVALAAERLAAGEGRPLARAGAALAALYAAGWLALTALPAPLASGLRNVVPDRYSDAFVAGERLRWAGLALFGLGLAAAAMFAARLARRRGPLAAALVAAVHLASQLAFLRPLLARDDAAPYRVAPPALAAVPPDSRVAHGGAGGLFGPARIPAAAYPDASLRWLQRQTHEELYPWAGVLWGRRYDFNLSPEGLDSFLTRAAAQAITALPDGGRVRVLAASGVDRLLLGRDLAAAALPEVEQTATYPVTGALLRVYRLRRAAAEVRFADGILRSPHLNATVGLLVDPAFDPARMVVLPARPGAAPEGAAAGPDGQGGEALGAVRVLASGAESVAAEVTARRAGALVWSRAWLPIYRARLDGRPVPIEVANLDRMAVAVPAGRHRVEIATDRRPLAIATAVAPPALASLTVAARRLGSGRGGAVRGRP